MSTRPRILMITTQLGYGGAETSFIRLANLLAQSMDVTVALFTSDYGMKSYTNEHTPLHVPVLLLDPAGAGQIRRWFNRVRRVRELKATHSVAISFLSGPNLVNAMAGNRRKTVVSIRGSRAFDPVSPYWKRWLFEKVLDKIIYQRSRFIVPVSNGLANEIAASADKIRPISPFLDLEAVKHSLKQPVVDAYQTLAGQPVIISIGRLSVEKGYQHLIRVVSKLSNHATGVKLLLVGDGPMRQTLRDQCSELGLAIDDLTAGVTSVVFAGYQRNVMPFLTLAKMYILSSATEGFPSVLLEAMVAGVPVFAADTPWGARAILREEASGDTKPYPTHEITAVAYGTLMPRIDDTQFDEIWVKAIVNALSQTAIPNPKAASRPQDYSMPRIGKQWADLIDEVINA